MVYGLEEHEKEYKAKIFLNSRRATHKKGPKREQKRQVMMSYRNTSFKKNHVHQLGTCSRNELMLKRNKYTRTADQKKYHRSKKISKKEPSPATMIKHGQMLQGNKRNSRYTIHLSKYPQGQQNETKMEIRCGMSTKRHTIWIHNLDKRLSENMQGLRRRHKVIENPWKIGEWNWQQEGKD